MKKAHLLHNPTAGDSDFSKEELVKLIRQEWIECAYSSVKGDGWEGFDEHSDFLIIAGGDGTVRRIAKILLKRTLLDKHYPIALLPHGTANNVACALGINGKAKDIIRKWHHYHLKPFDIGRVIGLDGDRFFLEAFGIGVFPRLMKLMERLEDAIGGSAEDKLNAARCALLEIVQTYEAKSCQIFADGKEHSGEYLMVEVMNIRSIGPNLVLAPEADPGDGMLEVVLITASNRRKFESFLRHQIDGIEQDFTFKTIRARQVKIVCGCKDLHIDDERIKVENPSDIEIDINPGRLEFIITDEE
ncbi:diacylglycerol/lipid kinase family protein [Dyadobacter crusticola]|uniref:diacylglycerol/lipid kinase family protein n=1 Tax=Dyadobacter crusticola TaxID=292407 RepID=UPI0004E19009|nr:diacylglycerol kinase family protein [Dyadobacter crusticola]